MKIYNLRVTVGAEVGLVATSRKDIGHQPNVVGRVFQRPDIRININLYSIEKRMTIRGNVKRLVHGRKAITT